MRDWSAIARLIRTKIENKHFDTLTVKNDLGHKHEKTTEKYIKFAEKYYINDRFYWLSAVLKFHPSSNRMKDLMKQQNWLEKEMITRLPTNGQNGVNAVSLPSVRDRWARPDLNRRPSGYEPDAPPD